MKKAGILGSGTVGKTLATGFLKHGYEVKIGSGHPDKLADWKSSAGENASTGSFSDAAKFGDIIVLAVKGSAAIKVIEEAGAANLAGKTVLDTTNPIADAPPENGVLKFFTNFDESLMEQLQKKYTIINFVKTFSSAGSAVMVNPSFKEGKPSMFICGNNEGAKKEAKEILDLFGWETEDMGGAEAARAIEPLCILWCIPGFVSNQWTHAFKLLK
jgi:8-hydroxy-5-deazaflavin:NADPH oxidoreductase